MKTKPILILCLLISMLCIENIQSQTESDDFEPLYITIRTLHGVEGSDYSEWEAIEKEYFDKVTSKINLILSHEVLLSYFNPNLSDIKLIDVYKSWDDIQAVNSIRKELIEKTWPDIDERNAFFEKQNSFYTNYHSDEIYTSTRFGKYLSKELRNANKKPFVFYEKINTLSDYEQEDSNQLYEKYVDKVVLENPLIRAYHPYRHLWGADSRDFVEVFVVNSIVDLAEALQKNKELLASLIPDKEKRKEFLQIYQKAILAQKDAVYKNVPSLSK